MTDFRALCAELVTIEDALTGRAPVTANQRQALDGFSALAQFRDIAERARAALAEAEPLGPTDLRDETLLNEADACFLYGDGKYTAFPEEVVAFARRILLAGQRWGRAAMAQPVPVGPTDEELRDANEQGADASRYLKYIEELSDVLVSCSEMLSEWGAYADEYYQKKHYLDADVAYAKSHAARAKRVAEQTDRLGEYDD